MFDPKRATQQRIECVKMFQKAFFFDTLKMITLVDDDDNKILGKNVLHLFQFPLFFFFLKSSYEVC